MSSGSADALYYSPNNLDNTYSQVAEEVLRRTNKDISKNPTYRTTFNKMAKMVYDKTPSNDRNLMRCNATLLEKCVTYFHSKIFEKQMNPGSKQQGNTPTPPRPITSSSSSNQSLGFTMIKDNEDLDAKMKEMIASRQTLGTGAGIRGDGNPDAYIPQPMLAPQQVINPPITSSHAEQFQRVGDSQSLSSNNPTVAREGIDFSIKPFNLSEDLTDSLVSSDNVDTPLYQNIENLQRMEGVNPMSVLEDYTRKRTAQLQQYAATERRENITAMQAPALAARKSATGTNTGTIIYDRNNTDAQTTISRTVVDPMALFDQGNYLADKYVERMEERIVNDDNIQTIPPEEVLVNQNRLIKTQRDTQPKYIEKVHYININSVDRNWQQTNSETRYNFQVKFNQNQDYRGGATISNMYRNIISVELVSSIMPMDSYVEPFDTRIYMGLSRYPYLLLRIEELDNVFRGTNNWVDKAFSTMIFDKVFYTNTLSTDYISGVGTSIIQSTPKQGFASEYLRGFMKYNPAYFEKKKYYNNPLANLNRMSIEITDPRGNFINTQNDVLDLSNISFTGNVGAVTGTELVPTFAWPFSTQGSYTYVKLTTTTYFSNRLFRVGDRIIIKNFAGATGANGQAFTSFINRDEGHIIINMDVETNGAANTNNRGFINNIYISPPGMMDSLNQTVDPATYIGSGVTFGTVDNWGRLIDMDLQTQLLFRIVTRDPDTSGTLQPINVY
jgi:hypothetical protein